VKSGLIRFSNPSSHSIYAEPEVHYYFCYRLLKNIDENDKAYEELLQNLVFLNPEKEVRLFLKLVDIDKQSWNFDDYTTISYKINLRWALQLAGPTLWFTSMQREYPPMFFEYHLKNHLSKLSEKKLDEVIKDICEETPHIKNFHTDYPIYEAFDYLNVTYHKHSDIWREIVINFIVEKSNIFEFDIKNLEKDKYDKMIKVENKKLDNSKSLIKKLFKF
jgi:hypothetical protein